MTSGSNSSPPGEQAAPQSSTQSLATDGSTGQFPSRSDQVTQTGVKPFLKPSGSPELLHRQAQDWEGSDDDTCTHNNRGLMASTQLCISQAETDDRDRTDNSFECFKSPTPSLSRSPRTPRYSSERFAVSDNKMI